MGLTSSLSIATSGLNAIEYQLAVTSENVSNSGTTGYVRENATVTMAVAGNVGAGVKIGRTALNVNTALQSALYSQNAQVASLTATSNSLAPLSSIQGSTSSDSGSTDTLSDELGNVQNALTSLTATPLQSASQSLVISSAQSLTSTIHTLAATYTDQRQAAEDNTVATVSSINSGLTQIGQLSTQIMKLQALGSDTANLENQRLEVMSNLSSDLSVTFSETSNGDMIVRTADGTELPTRPDQIGQSNSTVTLPSSTWPLSTSDATVTSAMYYKAGDTNAQIPGIMLAGKDITSHLTGGTLGANITLRDVTYPKMQAQLDSFSYTLASRFNNAGLPLFTDGTGAVPLASATVPLSDPTTTQETPNGLVGLSSTIAVSSSYANAPSSLTTNGDVTTITAVLGTAFGTSSDDVSGSDGSLAAPSTGLGPTGSLSTGYSGAQGLVALATALTSDQGATIGQASDDLTSVTSVQTTLQTAVSNASGVDVNNEMANVVALQNAYAANAKVVTAVQSMFSALLNAID
ncbi:flagellar hook-associated protein FlgK [Gluconacetobacter johannae DSM 13595]|uniref:Flagellar hook-associated protein 1 n=1 Tax=Gluconacetobacter johannae TaxID=112140 RepID=A0A7W4J7F4_9PROT|nr:flagellar basal body rod C-terminal domain-containing protein [Gluconacetobacter johannae]MBB2176077.1 flagellar hook-associated protein FlgK [Gluconacetobacter johannae]GBQ79987.1 flagellar hook-associated protein FlgK [Gluconacetobacter johannae DSM 13595]